MDAGFAGYGVVAVGGAGGPDGARVARADVGVGVGEELVSGVAVAVVEVVCDGHVAVGLAGLADEVEDGVAAGEDASAGVAEPGAVVAGRVKRVGLELSDDAVLAREVRGRGVGVLAAGGAMASCLFHGVKRAHVGGAGRAFQTGVVAGEGVDGADAAGLVAGVGLELAGRTGFAARNAKSVGRTAYNLMPT